MKHVGARRVRTMQEPGVVDSVCGERVPRLHLAHIGQSRRLFIADGIAAGIPSCGVNDCEAFALLLDHLCEVGGDLDVVIRVSDYNEPIHFIAGIWSGVSRGFLLRAEDRKSTRLNSSHGYISYAVFCL